MLEVAINQLLVGNVDQGSEEDDAGREEGHAPHGEELDEVVGEEGSKEGLEMLVSQIRGKRATYRCCDGNVLGVDYTLDLNDKEVDHLLDVVKSGFEGLFGDLVVFARTDRGGDAGAHDGLCSDLSKGDNYDCQFRSVVGRA
jgi:hypothetical protein